MEILNFANKSLSILYGMSRFEVGVSFEPCIKVLTQFVGRGGVERNYRPNGYTFFVDFGEAILKCRNGSVRICSIWNSDVLTVSKIRVPDSS